MRFFVVGAIALCAVVEAQAPMQKHVRQRAAVASVPPNTPVVTLQGVCGGRAVARGCETVITREDLDGFVHAFAPDASETARGGLAVQYAGMLAFSTLAEQKGLENNPALAKEIAVQLKLARMRLLATAFLQNLQKQTISIREPEIQAYYDQHRSQFEQAQMRRLSVPFEVPTEGGRPLDRSAVKAEMDVLRGRAAAGADLSELQQDAYNHLHIQATPPPISVATVRRGNVQGDEAKAFDLNPGEVSAVLDSAAALAVVKLESKEPLPLNAVRPEIEAALSHDRMQEAVRSLTKRVNAQFNTQYLGLSSQPDLFGLTAINPVAGRGSVRRASFRRNYEAPAAQPAR